MQIFWKDVLSSSNRLPVTFPIHDIFIQFLDDPPSLTDVEFELRATRVKLGRLPNLTRVAVEYSKLRQFITGRHLTSYGYSYGGSVDFTLSTAPIKKLRIDYPYLCQEPFHLLGSTFSSLTNLTIDAKLHYKHIEIVCDLDLI